MLLLTPLDYDIVPTIDLSVEESFETMWRRPLLNLKSKDTEGIDK